MKLKPLVKEWVEKAEGGDYATAQRELRITLRASLGPTP